MPHDLSPQRNPATAPHSSCRLQPRAVHVPRSTSPCTTLSLTTTALTSRHTLASVPWQGARHSSSGAYMYQTAAAAPFFSYLAVSTFSPSGDTHPAATSRPHTRADRHAENAPEHRELGLAAITWPSPEATEPSQALQALAGSLPSTSRPIEARPLTLASQLQRRRPDLADSPIADAARSRIQTPTQPAQIAAAIVEARPLAEAATGQSTGYSLLP